MTDQPDEYVQQATAATLKQVVENTTRIDELEKRLAKLEKKPK